MPVDLRSEPRLPRIVLAATLAVVLVAASSAARADDSTAPVYRTPDPTLVAMIDAPPTPQVVVGPERRWMLIAEQPALPPIAELARRELRLAGFRIDPAANGPSRTRPYVGLRLLEIATGRERSVAGLPAGARIGNLSWSPDGRRIAFTHAADDGIELWVVEVADARARRLTAPVLDLAGGTEPHWLADSRALVVPTVPADRGPEPPAPTVPTGPVIRENLGKTAPARTYEDLLRNPYDAALFEHYLTAQLVRVDLEGTVTPLGGPGLLWSVAPSPDGRFLLVETLHRPFSYLVPAHRFPRRIEVWDAAGHTVRTVADLPLQEEVPIPFGSVPTGVREVEWRADAPATLAWVEALDGGDAGRKAEERDRLFLLPAPFDADPVPLATLGLRFGEVSWGDDGVALVSSWWWRTRRTRTWVVHPGDPGRAPEILFDRSFEDRYGDPGQPLMHPNAAGLPVLDLGKDGKTLSLVGDGASPEGNRPFLDTLDLESRKTRRRFRSEAPYYEQPVALLDGPDGEGRRLLTRREAVEEPPNFYLRDLATTGDGGDLRRLTDFPHPTPQLAGVHKELIRYPRKDGVELTATLYTPAGWDRSQGPLPMLVWAYPHEFKSAAAAAQVTDSPYRFVRVGWYSPLLWLTQGYAVLDDPSMPIVGEGDVEPNDTYIEQLVASAQAAVDEVVRRGVAERGRIAIGGHSYGAFMVANLLAHSDLFAAGIARSGAYNRTLTPFGFQAEERTVWEAPEVYFRMSPFLHAEQVDEPILLIHGMADNNPGTFPIQSERFFNALKGLGGTARLVMLPDESHGYRARESVLHMLWEEGRWLERYVNEARPRPQVESPESPGGGPHPPAAGGSDDRR